MIFLWWRIFRKPPVRISFQDFHQKKFEHQSKNTAIFQKPFLKKERVFFFRGSALQVFGQCVGLQCGRSFGKTIFWGRKDLPKLRLISRPQKGVWGMNAGGFRIGGFRKIRHSKKILHIDLF